MNWEHLKKKEGEMIEKTKKVKYGKKNVWENITIK
jgi:hypothetical protein